MAAGQAGDAGALVVWRLSDGRAGHDNQSAGLVDALARCTAVDAHVLALSGRGGARAIPALLRDSAATPAPRLLVGAGHATHWPLLAARWRRGGRVVVLMRPSLPRRLFDLCVVPEHDGIAPSSNTLVTRGVLNRVRPAATREPRRALVLVGGPSRHHGWAEDALVAQIAALTRSGDDCRWLLCDSRRTPVGTRARLRGLVDDRVAFVGHDSVDRDWLPSNLATAGVVWVSEDSASMVYEALSGGAAVGVLDVPRRQDGRVARGVDALVAADLVRRFADWRSGRAPAAPRRPLAEADRVAAWIREHWLAAAC